MVAINNNPKLTGNILFIIFLSLETISLSKDDYKNIDKKNTRILKQEQLR